MLAEVSRDEFVNGVWDCRPGEHVLAIAPSGGGKSHLLYSLMEQTMQRYPDLSVVSLMPKPADAAVVKWADRLDLRETPEWPPRKKLFEGKPAGYLLWPPHPMNLDPDARRAHVGGVLRHGLDDQYKRGYSISFVDDAHSAATQMGLNSYLEEMLTNGRAGGAAAWMATQKPSGTLVSGGISSMAYGNATHLFLGSTPLENDIKRYTEISGLPPRVVEDAVRDLRMTRIGDTAVTEFIYVNKAGPFACRVLP